MVLLGFTLHWIEYITPHHHLLEKLEHLLQVESAQLPVLHPGRVARRKIYEYSP